MFILKLLQDRLFHFKVLPAISYQLEGQKKKNKTKTNPSQTSVLYQEEHSCRMNL